MERPGSAEPNGEKVAERTWDCPGHHRGRTPPAQRRRTPLYRPCSFWLVQALASTGRVDEAAQLFADLLELANPLGLLPEEISPETTATLATTPPALTHAALVQAALAIRDAQPD